MRIHVALVAALMAGVTLAGCAAKQSRTVQGVEIAEDKAGLWIKVEGKDGIDEVHVDARTGAVVAVKHDSE